MLRLFKFWGKKEDERHVLGRRGEKEARKYLRKEKGMKVVSKNWRPEGKRGEIDIIARDGATMVFVEVKTMKEGGLISGYYRVKEGQKRRIRDSAKGYMRGLRYPPKHFRFDIVEVKLCQEGEFSVNHYIGIPIFPKHYNTTR